tara:strand:- start:89 stop:478 length:390 start_codon:yes stop_codon:yes gene_type:complete
MADFYIKCSGEVVEGFPVAGNNIKLLYPNVDLTSEPPEGWVEFERRDDDASKLPHRYYKPVTNKFFEGDVYVEHYTFEEVTDADEKATLRASFYEEEHHEGAVFDETVGAWLRPEDVESLNNSQEPNVD